MNQDYYISLLYKQQSGNLSLGELKELDDWKAASSDNQMIAKSVAKAWDLGGNFTTDIDVNLDDHFAALEKKIGKQEAKVVGMKSRRNWLQIAAAVIMLIVAPYILYQTFLVGSEEWVVLQTKTGEQKELTLEDGTQVWLNENSSLSYLPSFSDEKRLVKLEGEAFFDVTKDTERKFIIEGEDAHVTVLGTSFNVRDREGEVSVSVKTGIVRLQPKGSPAKIDLIANERGVYNKSQKQLEKQKDEGLNDLAWRTKRMVFPEWTLNEMLDQINDFYKTDIQIESATMQTCRHTFTFDNKSLNQVLNTFRSTFRFSIENSTDNSYLLKGGNCP